MEMHEELNARGGIETMEGFGGKELRAVRHAARIKGAEIGGRGAPGGYADDVAEWRT